MFAYCDQLYSEFVHLLCLLNLLCMSFEMGTSNKKHVILEKSFFFSWRGLRSFRRRSKRWKVNIKVNTNEVGCCVYSGLNCFRSIPNSGLRRCVESGVTVAVLMYIFRNIPDEKKMPHYLCEHCL
jgi:hypothetical protein